MLTENQKSLLFHIAAEAGVSTADISSGEMQIAEMLVDDGLAYFDLTLRLTNAGWAALEQEDA